jgi:stage II sporulation protein AA (anti-sigma F factor antagonist)
MEVRAMPITYRVDPGVVTVQLDRDLDLSTAPDARAALDALLDRYPDHDMVMDLEAVRFVDSSGLGVILGRYRRLAASGRALHLTGVHPAVHAVLTVAGIRQIMSIEGLDRDGPRKGATIDVGRER